MSTAHGPQLSEESVGRLIVLAGLTDIRSDTLGFLLAAHHVDHIWSCLVSGKLLEFPRSNPDGKLLPLPQARAKQWGAEVRAANPRLALARHHQAGIQVLTVGQPGYPSCLEQLTDKPGVLFAQGNVSLLSETTRRAAIIGTRRATSYGRQVARSLGRSLSVAGVSVVSGLAAGIDGAAHAGSLAGRDPIDAPPIGVVGSGLDQPYPSINRSLWSEVRQHGLLISEWPLGSRPISWHFPARNRLIVGLSETVVVVESAASGGSMLSVAEATKQNVALLAVPGLVTSPASVGTHQLLAEGGSVCRGAEDVLDSMQMVTSSKGMKSYSDARRKPSADGAAVLCALGWDVLPVERLMSKFPGTTPGTLLLALHELEFDGWVSRGSDGWFQLAASRGR